MSGRGLPAGPRAEPQSEPEASLCPSSSGLLGASVGPVKWQSEGAILGQTDRTQPPSGSLVFVWAACGQEWTQEGLSEPVSPGAVVKFIPRGVTAAHSGEASLGTDSRRPWQYEGV